LASARQGFRRTPRGRAVPRTRSTIAIMATTPFASRVRALRRRFPSIGIDALLIVNPRDIHYLTGFSGEDSWALVPRRGKVTILSDARFDEAIDRDAPQCRKILRTGAIADTLKKTLAGRKVDKLGLQEAYLTLAQRAALVKRLGASGLRQVDDGLLTQRGLKDETEIAAIRKALKVQQQAFEQTREILRPGMSEREVAAELEYRMRALGADGVSFPTIVASNANASLPHAVPGRSRLNGYCSDLTRVVAVGEKLPPRIAEIYRIVLDAQTQAIDAIRPGARLADVDAVARQVIARAGYEKAFGHGLGHGIGLDVHESPTLGRRATGELQPGHVVTVEPGIYLPGVGGVRIEDDVQVTERGKRVLSDLPKNLESTAGRA